MNNINKFFLNIFLVLIFLVIFTQKTRAMHIAEGFLPLKWAAGWWLMIIPFLIYSFIKTNYLLQQKGLDLKMLLAVVGAFVFVLSSLKLPSLTGSSSHPIGIGLGAILIGPWPMVFVGCIVLLFQAVLLAHGGLTTLGANLFAMAVIGGITAYGTYYLLKKVRTPIWLCVFFGTFVGDIMTYVTTSIQLGLAFPGVNESIMNSIIKFLSVFAINQIPLAISEGILTLLVYKLIVSFDKELVKKSGLKGYYK
jgi:cobalt/nickel transport system permease protein